jgi:hypothetical protein
LDAHAGFSFYAQSTEVPFIGSSPVFNICVIRPQDYQHHQAFDELVDLLRYSIIELGHPCTVSSNDLDDNRVEIVVGCHLLKPEARLPRSAVILNTEPLFSRENSGWTERIIDYANRHRVWDYNAKNIAALKALGLSGQRLLRIGYQRELERVATAPDQDIDVLFYGSYNDRRRAVLEELQGRGLNVVTLFGVYGSMRDEYVSRAKVVLNMHYYNQHIFEVVRVFYLMINGKAVVAEVSPDTSVEERFLYGIKAVPHQDLVDACLHLVNDAAARQRLEIAALHNIRQWPQIAFTSSLIATV